MRALIAALSVAFALAALSGPAAGDGPGRHALLDSTVRFLQEGQRPDGGFAQAGEPTQGTSAWVALALAAAGINPRNQAQACGTDVYTYLAANFRGAAGGSAAQMATTAFDRELLVVNASGTDPHDFAGFDLIEEILARQRPDGSFADLPGGEGQINAGIFAILALSPVGDPAVAPASRRAAEWLIGEQNDDGGWSWLNRGTVSEVDMTGAAIEALNAVGPPSAPSERAAFESALDEGFEYLEDAQLPDGGFPALPPSQDESNVASTAWAVQGIWSAGGNPETWRTGSGLASEEPLDYMESMQQPDGHIRWSKSSDVNGIWMTAYVVPAFAGHQLPIPAATYSEASRPPCEPQDRPRNSGVIAGGGGRGAPLFSRPRPQSKGRTPGGARIVRSKGLRPRNHSSRRGENAEQPTGTASAEPDGADAGREKEVTAVSSATGRGDGDGSGGVAGHEVSGVVIGDLSSADGGEPAFGAPGLRSAETGAERERWVAAGIGGAALLLALGGVQWERRRQEALL